MEINRTSIDVDAAALQRMETRLVYTNFVQYKVGVLTASIRY